MDDLEDCAKFIWHRYKSRGDTWRRKWRNSWPRFGLVRREGHLCVKGVCNIGGNCHKWDWIHRWIEPYDSFWLRVQSVTLAWTRKVHPRTPLGPGPDCKIRVTPIPFPWIPLLSRWFPKLKHLTLEQAPLDDCIWADKEQWPLRMIPTDDLRTQKPFDPSTGNRLYEVSRLRILDGLEKALLDPDDFRTYYPLTEATTGNSNSPAIRKRGLLPHLQTLTIMNRDVLCTHSKAFKVNKLNSHPRHYTLAERQEYRRKQMTVYAMHQFIEIPSEETRPSAVGKEFWWPDETDETDTEDEEEEEDPQLGLNVPQDGGGDGQQGDFGDYTDASSQYVSSALSHVPNLNDGGSALHTTTGHQGNGQSEMDVSDDTISPLVELFNSTGMEASSQVDHAMPVEGDDVQ